MLRKLLAIVLLLHIGLVFAQNSPKTPPSPFSFSIGNDGQASLNNNNLPSAGLPTMPQNISIVDTAANSNSTNRDAIYSTNPSVDVFIGDTRKYLDNLSEHMLDPIKEKIDIYAKVIIKAALTLFLYLSIFMIIWRFIKYAATGGHEFTPWLADTILCIVIMQITIAFIKNSGEISTHIYKWFMAVGGEASGMKELKPSLILDLGVDYFINMIKFLTTLSYTDLIKGLVLFFIGSVTQLAIVGMVGLYIMAIAESLILAKVSIIFLGFLGLEQTKEIGMKPIFLWINIGFKLMFLQLMLGLEMDILHTFIKMDEINVSMAISVMIVSKIMLLLTWRIPHIFQNLTTGTTTMSGIRDFMHESRNARNQNQQPQSPTLAQQIGGVGAAIQAHQEYSNAQEMAKAQSSRIYGSNVGYGNAHSQQIHGMQFTGANSSNLDNNSNTYSHNPVSNNNSSNSINSKENKNSTSSNVNSKNSTQGNNSTFSSSNNNSNNIANQNTSSNNSNFLSNVGQGLKEVINIATP